MKELSVYKFYVFLNINLKLPNFSRTVDDLAYSIKNFARISTVKNWSNFTTKFDENRKIRSITFLI